MEVWFSEAQAMPAEVPVEEIAEAAMQAAFGVIGERLAAAGYPVSGDVSPGEAMQLDRLFASFVRSMALNNEKVAALSDEDAARCAECGKAVAGMRAQLAGGRFVVETCHGGSDWCVRDATAAEVADPDEETLSHAEACAHAADVAREHGTRWFDFSSGSPAMAAGDAEDARPRYRCDEEMLPVDPPAAVLADVAADVPGKPSGFVRAEFEGVSVLLGRADGGQLSVFVNTEDAVDPALEPDSNGPCMQVLLNDATLYDREPTAAEPAAAESSRTVLVHFNVAVPSGDGRSADEVAEALAAALEVGSDDDAVRELRAVVAMAEEI